MKILKLTLSFTILTLFFSCDNNKTRKQNEIQRVVFATGGCFGNCPVQVIDIDSSLIVKYHGIKYTDNTGYFIGNITAEFWDSLNIKLEKANYKQLDSSYEHSVDDLSTEIYIYYNNKVKHIHGQSSSLPDSVMKVYQWLITEIKQFKMKQTEDSLNFPTIMEKPMPLIQQNIKFIPPAIDEK